MSESNPSGTSETKAAVLSKAVCLKAPSCCSIVVWGDDFCFESKGLLVHLSSCLFAGTVDPNII